MGKGDQRTKRGKIWRGSHGKTRAKSHEPVARPEPKPQPKPERARPQPTPQPAPAPSEPAAAPAEATPGA